MSNQRRLFMQQLTFSILFIWLAVCHSEPQEDTTDYTPASVATEARTEAYTEPHNDPTQTLASKNSTSLQTELALYQTAAQKPWVALDIDHHKLKSGRHNPVVPLIRERLQLSGDLGNSENPDNTIYDKQLILAVKHFQARHNLNADGIIGHDTLTELNIPPEQRIKSIQVNLQRWSDLSKKLGERFIIVNIPDYQLYLFDKGNQVLMMKAIVGKPDWQTPELISRITRIVFNPYWNVPVTIAANDLVPKAKSDPYYLEDMHIKVFINNGNHSEQVDRSEIDWQNVKSEDTSYTFRQDPGDDNALGVVKFEFPNEHDVYLHDTPVKSLFEGPVRDLSHGCVRLEKPLDLVTYLMKDDPKWDENRTQEILDTHKTNYIKIPKPIPIYITYITVWADENGVVNYRDDIYQRDI
jgi:murein L,D-transpeptidase YcbB/YkuD